jgi:HD-GYP domain-containing protein (c-di-GMP phosphodiesterase class II)
VERTAAPVVRLTELLVGLSGVADLGMGQPIGSAARACFVAVELARATGCPETTVADCFFAALLQHVGCTAYSHEASVLFADELSVKGASLATDFTRPGEVLLGYLPRIVREAPAGQKLRTARNAIVRGGRLADGFSRANCEVGAVVARRLGLSDEVQNGLLHIFEAWNGDGRPGQLQGDEISVVARIVNVAGVVTLFDRIGGPAAAERAVRQRSGRTLDPTVADAFRARSQTLLGDLAAVDPADALPDVEPSPARTIPDADLDDFLRTFGDVVDLKAPFLHGHATGVAELAGRAAAALRLPDEEIRDARRAGYVHDVGRAGVPSRIWERPGPLGRDDWSQVRLHAYHSEQILARAAPLARLATLAGLHHERLDGSGYHRGTRAAQLPMAVRVLAAADVFQALRSARPHRPALSAERAAAEVGRMAGARLLDPDAVNAVIAAAGAGRPGARTVRAGLTQRQVEVLCLIAQGLSNRDIARRLTISSRTAEHHVQDVYARIGVSSRAGAAMFAMEHGLLAEDR